METLNVMFDFCSVIWENWKRFFTFQKATFYVQVYAYNFFFVIWFFVQNVRKISDDGYFDRSHAPNEFERVNLILLTKFWKFDFFNLKNLIAFEFFSLYFLFLV